MRNVLPTATLALIVLGCSKNESAPQPAPSASTPPPPPSTSAPQAAASTPPAAPSSAPEPQHDCPSGSTGIGSYAKPCDAKGRTRAMEVKWTKTSDKGPSFAITNKMQLVIVYGKIAVYFYDKKGKQLDVQDDSVSPPKARPFHTCGGQFFGGVMNPAEKEVLTFSCVPKSVVPEGTATVEGEMQMVGFTDASGKKVDFYWRNNDLTPDVRPKGGIK